MNTLLSMFKTRGFCDWFVVITAYALPFVFLTIHLIVGDLASLILYFAWLFSIGFSLPLFYLSKIRHRLDTSKCEILIFDKLNKEFNNKNDKPQDKPCTKIDEHSIPKPSNNNPHKNNTHHK